MTDTPADGGWQMLLEERHVERYARQIIMEEVGIHGQRRLLHSRVLVTGSGPGCEAARIYLRAAGVAVTADPEQPVDCIIAPDLDADEQLSSPPRARTEVPLVVFGADRTAVRVAVSATGRPSRESELPQETPESGDPASDALLAAAGCDAANAAIALLLAWPVPRSAAGINLA